MVTHTDRFCRKNISNEAGGEKEWGHWLRAPPRRVAGQEQSRWIREEGDDTWEDRIGGNSNYQHDLGGIISNQKGKGIRKEGDSRELVAQKGKVGGNQSNFLSPATIQGYNTTSNMLYDFNAEESVGLQLEERKRRRGDLDVGLIGHVSFQQESMQNKQHNQDSVISGGDLAGLQNNVLAELALQASQPQ